MVFADFEKIKKSWKDSSDTDILKAITELIGGHILQTFLNPQIIAQQCPRV